tara:strand:- start:10181 stop:10999 length:819 start_codon:yes stop_codon:yes gene_type:complete
MNNKLTEKQIASYRENGFLIIDKFLNEMELETWRKLVREAVSLRDQNRLPDGSFRLSRKVETGADLVFQQRVNLWMDNEGIRNLMLDNRLGKMAAELEGVDGIRIWHDQALIKKPWSNPTNWHQDNTKWSFESQHAITIWIALDDISLQNGCMFFLPKTHKKRLDDYPATGADLGAMFAAYPELGRMEPTPVLMPAGGCSFHNGLMIHAANPNMTPYPRRAFTCAYMPDQSRYNGIPNVLPNKILNTIQINDLLNDESQNPLIYSHKSSKKD